MNKKNNYSALNDSEKALLNKAIEKKLLNKDDAAKILKEAKELKEKGISKDLCDVLLELNLLTFEQLTTLKSEIETAAEPDESAELSPPDSEDTMLEIKSTQESDKPRTSIEQDESVSTFLSKRYNVDAKVNLPNPADGETVMDIVTGKTKAQTGKFPEAQGKSITANKLGKHTITGLIGKGGMGDVLSVFDEDLQRELAAKVIRSDTNVTKEGLEKFLIEAQITGQLEHPNIVPVHELGISSEGRIYFTMKQVRGKSLKEILEEEKSIIQGVTPEKEKSIIKDKG